MDRLEMVIAELRQKGLSPKEAVVMRALAQGRTEKQVASELGLSYHTVHGHVKGIYRTAGVHSRAELLLHIFSKDEKRR